MAGSARSSRASLDGALPASLHLHAWVVQAIGPGSWGNRVFVKIWDPDPVKSGFRLTVIYYERGDLVPDPFVDPFETLRCDRPAPTVTEDFDNLGVDPQGANYAVTTVNSAAPDQPPVAGGGSAAGSPGSCPVYAP